MYFLAALEWEALEKWIFAEIRQMTPSHEHAWVWVWDFEKSWAMVSFDGPRQNVTFQVSPIPK